MNNTGRVTSALDGTKTAENLRQAFTKEAEAFTKSSIFAKQANDDGDISAWKTLLEHADNDKRHSELWLSYLDEIGDTLENLEEIAHVKKDMSQNIYPVMADIADEEGFEEIAEKMRLVSDVKKAHGDMLSKESAYLLSPDAVYSQDPNTPWICLYCGYNVTGNTPPDRCPLCSYPRSFSQIN